MVLNKYPLFYICKTKTKAMTKREVEEYIMSQIFPNASHEVTAQNVRNAFAPIVERVWTFLEGEIGDLSQLQTTDKQSVVNAINYVLSKLNHDITLTKQEIDNIGSKVGELENVIGGDSEKSAEASADAGRTLKATLNINIAQGTTITISISGDNVTSKQNVVVVRSNENQSIRYANVGDTFEYTPSSDVQYVECVINSTNNNIGGTLRITVKTGSEGLVSEVERLKETSKDVEVIKKDLLGESYTTSVTVSAGKAVNAILTHDFEAQKTIRIKILTDGITDKQNVIVFSTSEHPNYRYCNSGDDFIYTPEQSISEIKCAVNYLNNNLGGTLSFVASLSGIDKETIPAMNKNTNSIFENFCKSAGSIPIATWIDDDASISGCDSVVSVICNDLNICPTIAFLPSATQSYLDRQIAYFKEKQREGWHITAHPVHTAWYGEGYDLKEAEKSLIDCLTLLQTNGFINGQYLIYPGSSSVNQDVVKLVQKWCPCAVIAGRSGANHLGTPTKWQIKRLFIELTETYNVAWYKNAIDKAFQNGDWVIFGSHSSIFSDSEDTADPSANTRGNLRLILKYAKDKGFPFYTFHDAWNKRKILFEVIEINK